jgi:hypothetical protein
MSETDKDDEVAVPSRRGLIVAAGGAAAGLLALGRAAPADAADVVPVEGGGTGQTTAEAARGPAGLNVEHRVSFSDADHAVQPTDRYVAQTGALTAPRTVTLPAAAAVAPGYEVLVADESGTAGAVNRITIRGAGADAIDGAATTAIAVPFGSRRLRSNGTNAWTVVGDRRHATEITATPSGELVGADVAEQLLELDLRAGSLRRLHDLRNAWEDYDDFVNTANANGQVGKLGWHVGLSGGATVAYPVASEQMSGGVVRLGTGTTSASAYCVVHLGHRLFAGAPELVVEWRARLEALNNGLQDYTVAIGCANGPYPGATAGFGFVYAPGDTSWHVVSAASATTNVDTNVPADTAWHRFRITCDGAGALRFYVDDALVRTVTTNLPAAQMWSPSVTVRKSSGTGTARSVLVDYFFGRVELLR